MSSVFSSVSPLQVFGAVSFSAFLLAFIQFALTSWKLRAIGGPLALPIVGHLYLPGAPQVMRFLSNLR